MRRTHTEDNDLKQKIIDKIIRNNRGIVDNNADDMAWTYSNAIPDDMVWIRSHLYFDQMYNWDDDWVDVYLSYEFFPWESYMIRIEWHLRYWWDYDEDEAVAREEFADILVWVINKANRLRNFLEEPQWDFTFVNM